MGHGAEPEREDEHQVIGREHRLPDRYEARRHLTVLERLPAAQDRHVERREVEARDRVARRRGALAVGPGEGAAEPLRWRAGWPWRISTWDMQHSRRGDARHPRQAGERRR